MAKMAAQPRRAFVLIDRLQPAPDGVFTDDLLHPQEFRQNGVASQGGNVGIAFVPGQHRQLYGHQEGAEIGYNPKKPGRPSHCYHSYAMAQTRLVLDVDVRPGDEHTSKHSAPGLWALLDRLPRDSWPALVRGDAGFGVESIMAEVEARGFPICSSCD